MLPVRREHESDERVIVSIDSTGNFDCFKMSGAEGIPWGLRKGADATGGQGGSARGNPERKLPANAGGLVIGIDASCLSRIGFPVGGLPIKKGRYDPPFTEIREPKFFRCIFDSRFVMQGGVVGFSDARGVASRIIGIKVLERFVRELQGSVKGKAPAAKTSSGEGDLCGWGFLVSIREGDLRLDGKTFREGESVWGRDVDLIAVGGFGLG